jgi:hypothetical protein
MYRFAESAAHGKACRTLKDVVLDCRSRGVDADLRKPGANRRRERIQAMQPDTLSDARA